MTYVARNIIRCIALIAILSVSLDVHAQFLKDTKKRSPLKNKSSRSVVNELQKSYRDIYKLYKDSVVFISTTRTIKGGYNHPFFNDPFFKDFFGRPDVKPKKRKSKGLGTGFIISTDGYICTNHHVIANIDSVTVTINDKEYKAKVIGSDKFADIALLKIKGKKFKPVYFGNSNNVQIGDFAIAIGNPYGLDRTLTSGIISAVGRKGLDIMGNTHIQTDASINQGNSGGPLINLDGEVIGVNRAIYSRTGGSIGIGFAIPVNRARNILIQLKKYGKVKRGYLGVQIYTANKKVAKKLGLKKPGGAVVQNLVKNGPAHKAGLKINDVILKVGNKSIKSSSELIAIVSKIRVGKTVKITVWRNKKRYNFKIVVSERPRE